MAKPRKNYGEEAGRLLLLNMASIENNNRNRAAIEAGTAEPAPTYEEKINKLIKSRIVTKLDADTYKRYVYMYNSLDKAKVLNELQRRTAESIFWKLYYLLDEFLKAEHENAAARYKTKIVTKSEYQRLKEEDYSQKMAKVISFEELVYDALEYYIAQHEKGIATPFDEHFKACREDHAANPAIISQFKESLSGYFLEPHDQPLHELSQEEVDARQLFKEHLWIDDENVTEGIEADLDKYAILKNARHTYQSDPLNILNFKADYPKLFEDVVAELAAMKGLEFIRTLSEGDYARPLIRYQDLYQNQILNYPALVETITTKDSVVGIAILEVEYVNYLVDEEGNYANANDRPFIKTEYLAENFIKEYSDVVRTELNTLYDSLKYAKAIETGFELIAECLKLPELKTIISPVKTTQVKILYKAMDAIPRSIIRYGINEEDLTEAAILEQLNKIFVKIDLETIDPTPSAIEAAKKLLDPETLTHTDMDKVYSVLRKRG